MSIPYEFDSASVHSSFRCRCYCSCLRSLGFPLPERPTAAATASNASEATLAMAGASGLIRSALLRNSGALGILPAVLGEPDHRSGSTDKISGTAVLALLLPATAGAPDLRAVWETRLRAPLMLSPPTAAAPRPARALPSATASMDDQTTQILEAFFSPAASAGVLFPGVFPLLAAAESANFAADSASSANGSAAATGGWSGGHGFGVTGAGPSDPERGICLNLDGVVMFQKSSGGNFAGGLGAAFIVGERGSGDQNWEKELFVRQKFWLQQQLATLNTKKTNLTQLEISVKSQGLINDEVATKLKNDRIKLVVDQSILKLQVEEFLRRKQKEGTELEQILNLLNNLLGKIDEMVLLLSKPSVADGSKADIPKESTNAECSSSNKMSCKFYLYGKTVLMKYSPGKNSVKLLLNCIHKVDRTYTVTRKFYPLVVGGLAWYTSGLQPDELWDLMEKYHNENSSKYKDMVLKYRDDKKEAAAEKARLADAAEKAKLAAAAGEPVADEVVSVKKWYWLWLM